MSEGASPKLMPLPVHKAFLVTNTLIWMVFRPLILLVAGPYDALVPEHTRYALFQLYCDLRTNPPRTSHWFKVHAARLQPHTAVGWLALGASVLYGTSGILALTGALLALTIGVLFSLSCVVITTGFFAGFAVSVAVFGMFGAAVAAVCAANVAAAVYVWISCVLGAWHWLLAPFQKPQDDPLEAVLGAARKAKRQKSRDPPGAVHSPTPSGILTEPPIQPAVFPSDETVDLLRAAKAKGHPVSPDRLQYPHVAPAGHDRAAAESDGDSSLSDHSAYAEGKHAAENASKLTSSQPDSPPSTRHRQVFPPAPSYMSVPEAHRQPLQSPKGEDPKGKPSADSNGHVKSVGGHSVPIISTELEPKALKPSPVDEPLEGRGEDFHAVDGDTTSFAAKVKGIDNLD